MGSPRCSLPASAPLRRQVVCNMEPKRFVVGISGASGAIYAQRLLLALAPSPHQVEVVASRIGEDVFRQETGTALRPFVRQLHAGGANFKVWDHDDFYAPFSSGSQVYDAMAVAPCSAGMLGRVATGVSSDLMSRACDVFLKESRPLVLLVREAPLSEVHLQNMLTLRRAGAIILPASPGFYTRPKDIPELADSLVQRVLDHMGLANVEVHRRWRTRSIDRTEQG